MKRIYNIVKLPYLLFENINNIKFSKTFTTLNNNSSSNYIKILSTSLFLFFLFCFSLHIYFPFHSLFIIFTVSSFPLPFVNFKLILFIVLYMNTWALLKGFSMSIMKIDLSVLSYVIFITLLDFGIYYPRICNK